jgi:hypothetical protein
MGWTAFDNGATVGQRGSEDGVILRDDEHDVGSRITLERDGRIAPFAITCGIYGWMFHTRWFATEREAAEEYARMTEALTSILEMIPYPDDPEAGQKTPQVIEAIGRFVDRFL